MFRGFQAGPVPPSVGTLNAALDCPLLRRPPLEISPRTSDDNELARRRLSNGHNDEALKLEVVDFSAGYAMAIRISSPRTHSVGPRHQRLWKELCRENQLLYQPSRPLGSPFSVSLILLGGGVKVSPLEERSVLW